VKNSEKTNGDASKKKRKRENICHPGIVAGWDLRRKPMKEKKKRKGGGKEAVTTGGKNTGVETTEGGKGREKAGREAGILWP